MWFGACDAVHGVEPRILVLVAVHAVSFDLLDESIDVVGRGAVRRLATDALQEDGRVTDPSLTLPTSPATAAASAAAASQAPNHKSRGP